MNGLGFSEVLMVLLESFHKIRVLVKLFPLTENIRISHKMPMKSLVKTTTDDHSLIAALGCETFGGLFFDRENRPVVLSFQKTLY